MGNAVLLKQSKKVHGSPVNLCVHQQKCDPTVSDKQAHNSTIMVTFPIGSNNLKKFHTYLMIA